MSELVPITANIEIAWRPGQRSGRTTFTTGWANVTDDEGTLIGTVEAKIDGSVEIRIGEGFDAGWTFRLRVPELWRIANEAKRIVECRGPVGLIGQRDPEFPCAEFTPGKPAYGRCDGDGHYLCDQCEKHSTRLTADAVDGASNDSAPVGSDGDRS